MLRPEPFRAAGNCLSRFIQLASSGKSRDFGSNQRGIRVGAPRGEVPVERKVERRRRGLAAQAVSNLREREPRLLGRPADGLVRRLGLEHCRFDGEAQVAHVL